MNMFPSSTSRDSAIVTICSNMAWTGVLPQSGLGEYMLSLHRQSDDGLAQSVVCSHHILCDYLGKCWSRN